MVLESNGYGVREQRLWYLGDHLLILQHEHLLGPRVVGLLLGPQLGELPGRVVRVRLEGCQRVTVMVLESNVYGDRE
jgi:hypothetical protein